jgi:hypothetical protein
MLWAISGKYLDILSSLVTTTLQLHVSHLLSMIVIICVTIHQIMMTKMVPIHKLWHLYVTLTLVAGAWIRSAISLKMVNICVKWHCNPLLNVEVGLRTSILYWPLSVTLTLNQEWSDVVHAFDSASHNGESFYDVSLESLYACKRYAQGKNFIFQYDLLVNLTLLTLT